MNLEIFGKAFENHLRQLSELQVKYGNMSAYDYFEMEKKALISQYEAMIKAVSERKDILDEK